MVYKKLSIMLPIISTIFFILLFKKLWPQRKNTAYNLPPGPWKLPIIGSMHHLIGQHVHRRLRKLAEKFGPIFHLKLGEINLIVITSANLAAETMKAYDLSFSSRPQFMGSKIILYNSGDIVFAPYGKLWAQLRKICTIELFNSKRVKHFITIMDDVGNNLIEKIRMADGSPVNMTTLFLSVGNTTISRICFGKECAQQDKIFSAVKDAFKYMSGFNLPDLFPSYSFLGDITGMRRRLLKAHRILDSTLDEIFEEHQTNSINNRADDSDEDVVDVLLRLKKSGELDATVTMDNLKGVTLDLMLGGTESTSSIMEWALAELIRHPEVMQKAQFEVRKAFKDKTIIHENHITNLPYLTMVIKEVLRVRPPAPFLVPRYCSETVELGGYTIPAGSRLLINAWAIMRDPKYWKDADNFKPERVADDIEDFNVSRFKYLPFGGGRRICPGSTFGLVSIQIVLAKLLYHFDWTLPEDKRPEDLDMEETIGLNLTRKNPLFLVATPYN